MAFTTTTMRGSIALAKANMRMTGRNAAGDLPWGCRVAARNELRICVRRSEAPRRTMGDSTIRTWGTTAAERAGAFPCDSFVTDPDDELYRGVTVAASAPRAFRWLCQLRVAPYSYDWIDNLGRQSPRRLIAGLENLAVGQDVMQIFTLLAYEKDRHLTLRTKPGRAQQRFGEVCVSYLVVPRGKDECRLVVKMVIRYPSGVTGAVMRRVLPAGDLFMMRRQLLNLKALAESSVDRAPGRDAR